MKQGIGFNYLGISQRKLEKDFKLQKDFLINLILIKVGI